MNCLKFTDMWSTFFFFHAEFIFIVGNFCISCLFCGLHDILLSFARTSSKCQFHAGSTKCSKRNVICSGIYEIDLHKEVKPPVKPLVNLSKSFSTSARTSWMMRPNNTSMILLYTVIIHYQPELDFFFASINKF